MMKKIFLTIFCFLFMATSSLPVTVFAKQGGQSSQNSGVVQRTMKNNMDTLSDTPRSDFVGNSHFIRKRLYTRQQATISYLAKIALLKTKFKEAINTMNNLKEEVKRSSKASTNQSKLEGSENKVVLLQKTALQKIAVIKFLYLYKQLRSALLEYEGIIAYSNSTRNKSYWKPDDRSALEVQE